jgi:hypothetical protein
MIPRALQLPGVPAARAAAGMHALGLRLARDDDLIIMAGLVLASPRTSMDLARGALLSTSNQQRRWPLLTVTHASSSSSARRISGAIGAARPAAARRPAADPWAHAMQPDGALASHGRKAAEPAPQRPASSSMSSRSRSRRAATTPRSVDVTRLFVLPSASAQTSQRSSELMEPDARPPCVSRICTLLHDARGDAQ